MQKYMYTIGSESADCFSFIQLLPANQWSSMQEHSPRVLQVGKIKGEGCSPSVKSIAFLRINKEISDEGKSRGVSYKKVFLHGTPLMNTTNEDCIACSALPSCITVIFVRDIAGGCEMEQGELIQNCQVSAVHVGSKKTTGLLQRIPSDLESPVVVASVDPVLFGLREGPNLGFWVSRLEFLPQPNRISVCIFETCPRQYAPLCIHFR